MAEITKSASEAPRIISRPVKVALAALAFVAYFAGLTLPLMGPDEPRYAQVAREMLERGDWITPTLGGTLWFEKPVLLYWLEKIAYHIFGVNEFAARLGPHSSASASSFAFICLEKVSTAVGSSRLSRHRPSAL